MTREMNGMTKTAAAENVVVRAADKEKVEKRRALGRGLESLLPGPRVVGGTAPGQSGGAGGRPQIPHFVRNDKDSLGDKTVSNDGAVHPDVAGEHLRGEAFDGVIRAVAEESAGVPHATGELHSPGQP